MNTQTVLFCFIFFLLASMQCEASTRTLKVEDEGLAATYYAPDSSDGKMGVLVLGGSEGGLPEKLAKPIVEAGFPTLALAYFKDGKQYMFEKQFYPNGQLKAYAPMKLGEIHGLARTWYENGTVQSEVNHVQGVAQTNGKFYDIDGKLMPEKIRARPKFSH